MTSRGILRKVTFKLHVTLTSSMKNFDIACSGDPRVRNTTSTYLCGAYNRWLRVLSLQNISRLQGGTAAGAVILIIENYEIGQSHGKLPSSTSVMMNSQSAVAEFVRQHGNRSWTSCCFVLSTLLKTFRRRVKNQVRWWNRAIWT